MIGFLPDLLYDLKRRYGKPLTAYHIVSITPNITSGRPTTVITKTIIKRAIQLPNESSRSVLGILKSSQFKTSGSFDKDAITVIIDPKDLGSHEITVDDYCILLAKHYKVVTVDSYQGQAFFVTMAAVEGQQLANQYEEIIAHNLSLAQNTGGL